MRADHVRVIRTSPLRAAMAAEVLSCTAACGILAGWREYVATRPDPIPVLITNKGAPMRSRVLTKAICWLAVLLCVGLADAQTFPRLKPIPPRGPRNAVSAANSAPALVANAAVATALSATTSSGAAAASPWQALTNQPPFTTNDCNGGFPGAANPLLLTDGSVIVQDAGCPDWWRLTPDSSGSYANGTWTQIGIACSRVDAFRRARWPGAGPVPPAGGRQRHRIRAGAGVRVLERSGRSLRQGVGTPTPCFYQLRRARDIRPPK